MSYLQNSLTLYMRPMENIPAYQIRNAANFLVFNNKFRTYQDALKYLLYTRIYAPWNFKAAMSDFYAAYDVTHKLSKAIDVNSYRSTNSNLYGEEYHMWH